MDTGNDKFAKPVLLVNKLVIKFLVCLLTIALILATLRIVVIIYQKIVEPPFLLIEADTLFDGFSLVLIIAIGYELVKSLLLVISSQSIPSLPIVQIAIIAVANKIITTDMKHAEPYTLVGLASVMAALGLTYFFHTRVPAKATENNKA